MNCFIKKAASVVMALIIAFASFIPSNVINADAAEPIEIGYSVSEDYLSKGDTVEVIFFFKNFEELDIECSAFQLDIAIDPSVFSVVTAKCNIDGNGAMMFTTKYNSTQKKLKTVYFNTASYIPRNTVNITTFTLRAERDYEEITEEPLKITLAMALDMNSNYYDLNYSSPTLKCGPEIPSAESPDSAESTLAPSATASDELIETVAPIETPDGDPTEAPATSENVSEKKYIVNYYSDNGKLILTEQVAEGDAVANSAVPNRPGFFFEGWKLDKGSLQSVNCDINAIAVYSSADIEYTIKVNGGTLPGGVTSGSFLFDDCVIVRLDESAVPEGKYFAGWSKEGVSGIVNANTTYSFLASESTEITAVYAEEPVTAVPSVTMYDHSFYMYSGVFTCERYIPADYKYSGSGIIITRSDSVGSDEAAFVLYAEDTSFYRAQDSAINAQFSLIHTDVSVKTYARAYLICKNADGEAFTLYSDIAVYDPDVLF